MKYTDEPPVSLERLYEARERRAREVERKRERLQNATSISEYIDIKLADATPPLQQTANVGHAHMKRR